MRSLAVAVFAAAFVATAFAAEEAVAEEHYENSLVNRVKRQLSFQQPGVSYQQPAINYNQPSISYQQQPYAGYQPYGGSQAMNNYGSYNQQARCNPCYPSSNQWCNRDPSCQPAPGYCTVICGMPTTSGSCDYTFQCRLVAGSERVAASMAVVGAVAAAMLL